jgi:hypothetical protein
LCPMENPLYEDWPFRRYHFNKHTEQEFKFNASTECNVEQVPDISTVCIPCWGRTVKILQTKRLGRKRLNSLALAEQLKLTDSCFDLVPTPLGLSGSIRATKKSPQEQTDDYLDQARQRYTNAGFL